MAQEMKSSVDGAVGETCSLEGDPCEVKRVNEPPEVPRGKERRHELGASWAGVEALMRRVERLEEQVKELERKVEELSHVIPRL